MWIQSLILAGSEKAIMSKPSPVLKKWPYYAGQKQVNIVYTTYKDKTEWEKR